MTQGLWVVNSSILAIFIFALMVSSLLRIEPPKVRLKQIQLEALPQKKEPPTFSIKSWEKIYQNDIFGTFEKSEATTVNKQSFITPIPEPKLTPVIPPPDIKKVELVAPLNISIKGIIIAAEELKSVAMIADETGKEGMYHIGEKIKDAEIIKIAQTRVIFLRANGQQETFYLRKDDLNAPSNEKWTAIVKKIDDQTYQVDPTAFKEEISSLGNFIERASVIGTVYHEGNPIGIRIGKEPAGDVGEMLGLVENDIITSINNISTSDAKNRMQIYDTITAMQVGSTIQATLTRADKAVVLSYQLAKLEKPKKQSFFGGTVEKGEKPPAEQALKMSRTQQREQTIREFSKQQPPTRNQQTLTDIRRRLLDNLHNRLRHARTR